MNYKMKSLIAVLLVCILSACLGTQVMGAEEKELAVSTFDEKETPLESSDIYWRPWKGKTPRDAVIVGETLCEAGMMVPVYLAQVFLPTDKGSIQPVSLFSHSRFVRPTYAGTAHHITKNIEILCSKNQNIFTWIPINETRILKADEDCVVGGTELGSNLFYGITSFQGYSVFGKVVIQREVMYFPNMEKEEEVKKEFDVLCYKNAVQRRLLEPVEKKTERPRPTTPRTRSAFDLVTR